MRKLAISIMAASAVAGPLAYFKVWPFNQGVNWPGDFLLIVAGASTIQLIDWSINRYRNRS